MTSRQCIVNQPYWRLHGDTIPPLERLVDDYLDMQEAVRGSLDHLPLPNDSAAGQSPDNRLPLSNDSAADQPPDSAADPSPDNCRPLPNDTAAGQSPDSRRPLLADHYSRQAQQHVLRYLLHSRRRPGVTCLPGIDSLALYLYCAAGDAAGLEAFVAEDLAAPADDAAATMQATGRCVVYGAKVCRSRSKDLCKAMHAGDSYVRAGPENN